jgi:hypothetical protein
MEISGPIREGRILIRCGTCLVKVVMVMALAALWPFMVEGIVFCFCCACETFTYTRYGMSCGTK